MTTHATTTPSLWRRYWASLTGRRLSPWQQLATGSGTYEVTFARSMHDIETVIVRADSCEQAIIKAERWLFANIFPRAVVKDGVHLWPPSSRRAGMAVAAAAEIHAGRVPDAPVTDLTTHPVTGEQG